MHGIERLSMIEPEGPEGYLRCLRNNPMVQVPEQRKIRSAFNA